MSDNNNYDNNNPYQSPNQDMPNVQPEQPQVSQPYFQQTHPQFEFDNTQPAPMQTPQYNGEGYTAPNYPPFTPNNDTQQDTSNTQQQNPPYTEPYEFMFRESSQPTYPVVNPQLQQSFDSKEKKEKKRRERKGLSGRAVAVVLVICILLSGVCGAGGAYLVNRLNRHSGNSLIINQVEKAQGEATSAEKNELTLSQISAKAADSVVEITTEYVTTGSFMQQYISSGAGSGVIISADGYIISNNHVIENATSIAVTLKNGESHVAKLIGTDENLDIALIKIEAEGLTPAVFGDSSTLSVGDTAVAIGNPLGQLGGTVTSGIISALDRDIDIGGVTMSLLQTSAAINPGNSGGGLFNGNGELIGIVVAKSSGSDVEGLGFAIPINDVMEVLEDLKNYGYVKGRIYLGLSLIDITNAQTALMYGLSEVGVYVNTVDASSAAGKAGIQAADRIVSIDGKEVSTADEVQDILDDHKVGDSLEFYITRTSRLGQTSEGSVTVILEEYVPQANKQQSQSSQSSQPYGDDYLDYFNDIFGDFFN